MREILFRGKGDRKYNSGNWYHGYLSKDCDGDYVITEIGFSRTVIPETVGQYTGLTDNNHDGIFEGDIVRCKQEKNEGICVVRWFNGAFVACPISGNLLEMTLHDYWYNDYDLVEVIGNETDNPELLKGE